MSKTNDFVPFCNENTGTNLPTQSAYLANPNLPLGNQPGIASSSLNNKALRQGSTMAAVVAQFVSDQMAVDMLDNQNSSDHAIPPALYAALTGAFKRLSPVITTYTSGSGNHNVTYKFMVASANATVGATYSDGTTTYTVTSTISAGTELKATGGAIPVATAGTLTKTGGTGDATITYYVYRSPLYLRVRGVGAGGGGAGGASTAAANGTDGGNGGNTTFGTSLLTANGGSKGTHGTNSAGGNGGAGGTASIASPAVGQSWSGAQGQGGAINGAANTVGPGGYGATSNFGNGGFGGNGNQANGGAASANSGSGGGGGSFNQSAPGTAGGGGGAGGYFDAYITSPASTYAYSVGAAGSAGSAGTSGGTGAVGGAGLIIVEEHYQ